MKPKFKLGDRVKYIGKISRGYPIPDREYNINSNARYRRPLDYNYVVGDYVYSLIPASGNDDKNTYSCIEEKYLALINPSKIIFG